MSDRVFLPGLPDGWRYTIHIESSDGDQVDISPTPAEEAPWLGAVRLGGANVQMDYGSLRDALLDAHQRIRRFDQARRKVHDAQVEYLKLLDGFDPDLRETAGFQEARLEMHRKWVRDDTTPEAL